MAPGVRYPQARAVGWTPLAVSSRRRRADSRRPWSSFVDETGRGRWAGRLVLVGLTGAVLAGAEVVGEGRQISGLGCGQVGERRGGLAWNGGIPEGGPGEHGDRDVEGVVAERPPVALGGGEAGGLTRPGGQHGGKKNRRHRRRVAGPVGRARPSGRGGARGAG